MIVRFVDATATLAAGLAIGLLIAGAGRRSPDVPAAHVPHLSATDTLLTVSSAENALTGSDDTSCDDITPNIKEQAIATPEPVPEVYRDIVGPLAEQTSGPEPYDLYVAFAHDVRDEPWAAAMEAGIANWSAGKHPSAEPVIDYVECRSSICVIAGHSSTGSRALLGSMRDEGWWQAEGAPMGVVYSGHDGSVEFLTFVTRYADTN